MKKHLKRPPLKYKDMKIIAPSMNMKSAIRYWVLTGDWDISATLTYSELVRERDAYSRLKKFWNRVDRRLYGNEMKKRNRRVERLNIMEGDGVAQNHHFHCVVKMPIDRFQNPFEFSKFLARLWREENGKMGHKTDIGPIIDELGWAIYITKKITRLSSDMLDATSSHVVVATC